MVIFKGGNLNLFVRSADLTLSFDSWIEELASPTIEKLGSPFVNVASTSTQVASSPSKQAHFNCFI